VEAPQPIATIGYRSSREEQAGPSLRGPSDGPKAEQEDRFFIAHSSALDIREDFGEEDRVRSGVPVTFREEDMPVPAEIASGKPIRLKFYAQRYNVINYYVI
jgi:hypothetical protein